MTVLQTIFDDVSPLGVAMIAARLNRWHNMNKTILNEFKAVWEQAMTTVIRDTQADGFLSGFRQCGSMLSDVPAVYYEQCLKYFL